MKEDTYVVIQAFMLNDLHLKGNELIVYAVIYGYTQDGEHWYYGTRGHLAEWCGATRGTVSNCLKSLLDKGYIRKREVERLGVIESHYQAVREILNPLPKINTPPIKNCDTPLSKISSINNKELNTKEIVVPTRADVERFMEDNGADAGYAELFYAHYDSQGWRKCNGLPLVNWKASAWAWLKKDGISKKPSYPKKMPCACGGTMRITAARERGVPLYSCDACGAYERYSDGL